MTLRQLLVLFLAVHSIVLMEALPPTSNLTTEYILQEQQCIQEALWYEARGESKEGIRAVLEVIQNRVKEKNTTFCAIIHAPKQFSYRNHLKVGQIMQDKPKGTKGIKTTYKTSNNEIKGYVQDLAFSAVVGGFKGSIKGVVMFYHTITLKKMPQWARKYQKVATIGNHVFYVKELN
jgi:N-acetylmuramoyl-L-alanine amidase